MVADMVGRVTCESCGAVGEELHLVHRMYVTPANGNTDGSEVTMPGTERVRFACCTMYPFTPCRLTGPDSR